VCCVFRVVYYAHGRSQVFFLEGLRTEAPYKPAGCRDRDVEGVEEEGYVNVNINEKFV